MLLEDAPDEVEDPDAVEGLPDELELLVEDALDEVEVEEVEMLEEDVVDVLPPDNA